MTITAIKGFNLDWTCRGYQFEIGKTYKHDGEIVVCQSGFHAIEGHPLEVFEYYAPGGSRYAEIEAIGPVVRHDSDSKIASAEITIKAELYIPEIVARAVKWVFDRSHPEEGGSATGTQGAAMASGYEGRVRGKEGSALFLVERDDSYNIIAAWAGIVGKKNIKADTWYTLKAGKPVRVDAQG